MVLFTLLFTQPLHINTMPNFYYTDANGQRQGAFTPQQIKALVEEGVITQDTPLEADTGHKGKAGQIKGLFNVPPAPNPFIAPITSQAVPQSVPVPAVSQSHNYDYRRIASWYRLSTWSILIFCSVISSSFIFLLVVGDMNDVTPLMKLLSLSYIGLELGAIAFSWYCLAHLAKKLHYGDGTIILFQICILVVWLGWIPLFQVYYRASDILKQAGYQVDWFGTDMQQFDDEE